MHQNNNPEKVTKTIVALTTFIEGCMKIMAGTGTYSDMVVATTVLRYCENKLEINPRLGFVDELKEIRITLSDILNRVTSGKIPTIDDWICPFVTITESNDIERFIFLLEHQFVGAPVLDTDKSLDDQYKEIIKRGRNHEGYNVRGSWMCW